MMKIEVLPMEIFPLIQEYLTNSEYRNLMNSNKSYFDRIKYQSVRYYYSFEIRHQDSVLDGKLLQFEKLLSKVKDKSKQIGIQLISMNKLLSLWKFIPKFPNIHYLSISFHGNLYPTFNFNVFNHIHTVQLIHVNEVIEIHSGFENVQQLDISYANKLEKISLNFLKMKSIRFVHCPFLLITSEFFQCPSVEIDEVQINQQQPEQLQLSRKIPYQALLLHSLPVPISSFTQCNLSSLERLILHSLDIRHGRDLSMFSHVRYLSLGLDDQFMGCPMIFPEFHGQYLELFGFNLMTWTSSAMIPAVRTIRLIDCLYVDPVILINVRDITLLRISGLAILISLPACINLSLSFLDDLVSIAPQPKLLRLMLSSCSELIELSPSSSSSSSSSLSSSSYPQDNNHPQHIMNSVQIYDCPKLNSYEICRNCRNVRCSFTDNQEHSFPHFDQSIVPSAERTIEFTTSLNRRVVIDCSHLGNIDKFILSNSRKGQIDCFGIHDIRIVSISYIDELTNVFGIKNIHCLQLEGLRNLESFDGLENIDTIMLSKLSSSPPHNNSNQIDYQGLKNCKIIYSHEIIDLDDQAVLYAKGDVSKIPSKFLEIFSNVQEYYLVEVLMDGWVEPALLPPQDVVRLW